MITGRKQLLLVSDAELLTMSLQSYQQFIDSVPTSKDLRNKTLVRNVGVKIANAVATASWAPSRAERCHSRARASKDMEGLRQSFAENIKLNAVSTVIFTAVSLLLAKPILLLTNTPPEILKDAYAYIAD